MHKKGKGSGSRSEGKGKRGEGEGGGALLKKRRNWISLDFLTTVKKEGDRNPVWGKGEENKDREIRSK